MFFGFLFLVLHFSSSLLGLFVGLCQFKAHRGVEPGCGFLILLDVQVRIPAAATHVSVTHVSAARVLAVCVLAVHISHDTAFGVFFWLEVLDFDRFPFLVLLIWHV